MKISTFTHIGAVASLCHITDGYECCQCACIATTPTLNA